MFGFYFPQRPPFCGTKACFSAILFAGLLTCLGCKHRQQATPPEIYSQIEHELIAGDLSKAHDESRQAYEYFRVGRPDWAGTFRIELAKVMIYQGESGEALALLKGALPIQSAPESEVQRNIFLSIAEARLGHLDEAKEALLEAERKCPEGKLRAEVASTRGSIDLEIGDLDGAERSFQLSLAGALLSGDQFLQTRSLTNLAVVALREEHYEDSLARFIDSSSVARSIGAKQVLEKAVGSIGWVYYKTGDFQRALLNSKEAGRQAEALSSIIDQVRWLNNEGLNEYRLGDLIAARSSYERSLSLAQSIQNQEETLDARVNLGFLHLRLGDLVGAANEVREANRLAALRNTQRAQLEPRLLGALLLKARGDSGGATKELLALEDRNAEVPSLRWATESSLAHIYAETGQKSDADTWFRKAIDTFHRQRSSLKSVESTLPFLENGTDLYDGYMEFLVGQGRTDEALDVVDASRAESLLDGLKASPVKGAVASADRVDARAVAARMGATVLVYSLRPKVSYLWAVTGKRIQFYVLPGSETILPLVQQQTKAILASKDLLAQQDSAARTLYGLLVRPAEGMIRRGGRVFIVGDAGLNSLNFETLVTGEREAHYWIEDVTVTNAKSLRLLSARAQARTRAAERRILLIGDPVYRREEYAELANAASEVTSVAGHFDERHRAVFTGAGASPQAYEDAQPGQFSYIHFVAHATANMTSPLDSAVVLSRDDGATGSYKLYARDILKQGLKADLVTLSACYGSGLRDYSGEGLVGLAWAFLRAGSHEVIGAMWEVSDASTPVLMDDLYGGLAKGAEPDAALRSAKLAMIHAGGVFRKPLYWAPFQLYAGA